MAQVKQSFLKDRRNAALGAAFLVALSLGVSEAQPSRAADFSHVKHVFVPPSRIPRRFDYESQGGGREATFYDAAPPTGEYIPPVPSSSGKPGKYGMVPPPPPVTPSLLPSSLKIPPPPPAPSIIRSNSESSPSSFGAPQRNSWSSTVQTTMDKTRTPVTNNVLDRAQQKVESLIQQGKLTEAQDLVKQYMLAFPKDKQLSSQMVRATVEKAKGLLEANDAEGAAKQAREALYIDGGNVAASTVLAQALTKSGTDPKSSAARIKAGDSLSAQGRNAEAEVEYRAAVKIKSTTEAHIGLGNALYKQGKRDQAKSEYQQALELNPDSPVALRQMGIVRLATNDVVGANANLTRALVIDPTDKVAGKSLLDLWQRQVSRNPKDANSHLGLARAYQLTGDLKSAQASYRTVVHIDPNHPNLPAARHSFKLALARQEAIKSYEAAKTLDSHGATREAFDRMVEAVGLFPAEMSYRLYQAELAEKLGMIQQAHDYYVFILREDPKNAIAAQRLKALPVAGANGQPVAMHATAGSLAQMQAVSPSQLLEAPPAKTIAPPPVVIGSPALGALGGSAPTPKMAGDTNVNSIAGFLGQLRNFSLVQQQQLKTTEDNAQSAIKGLTAALSPAPSSGASSAAASASSVDVPPISIPGLGTIPGLGGTTGSATSPAPSALGALAGTSAQATAAASAADSTASPSMTGLALAPLLNGNDKAGLAALGAQAAPALMSGKMSKFNQNDVDNVYSLLKGPISKKLGLKTAPPQAVNSGSDAPPTAPAVASALTVTPDQLQMAMQRLGNLETRNNELQAQLAQAHQAIKDLKSSTPNFMMGPAPTTATPSFMTGGSETASTTPFMAGGFATSKTPPVTSAPTTPFMAGGFMSSTPSSISTPVKPFMAGGFATSAPKSTSGNSINASSTPASSATSSFTTASSKTATSTSANSASAPAAESKIFVPGSTSNSLTSNDAQPMFQTETPRYATPSDLPEPAPTPSAPATPPNLGNNNVQSALPTGAVKLELEGVNASMTDIKLKVILRNQQNESLSIPSSAQAIVRMSGRPDRKAKVSFPSASIPAHGEVRGIIKVSGHDLNPSADVFIPLTTASGSNEIHLTVPISSL